MRMSQFMSHIASCVPIPPSATRQTIDWRFDCSGRQRGPAQNQVQPEEAQAEQEAEDAVHDATAPGAGEEVPGQAVLEHRRKGRVLQFVTTDRDAGED